MSDIQGIHHVTAISGTAHENYQFYTQVLGLRLVKKTVNFDDPGTYHLYYGDREGSPGTLMTFFPYGGSRGKSGSGQVTTTLYRVGVGGVDHWAKKLQDSNLDIERTTRDGRPALRFSDPHGMALEMVEHEASEGFELRQFYGAELAVDQIGPTSELLSFLGLEDEGEGLFRFPNGDLLQIKASETRGYSGPGTVHHIALRLEDDEAQAKWRSKLARAGYSVSPVMDRNYFHSIYFRGPGGILFELATDPPGMMIDEPLESLGEKLQLPPQYEGFRDRLERVLEPLEEPYKFVESEGPGPLIVSLHGTGGDEYDLTDLVEQLAPGRATLALRGNVSERGLNRFFRRLRAGVFDQDDLGRRVQQLGDFLLKRSQSKVAVGYSNGANMAAATLMARPESFQAAVLFRPMLGWTWDESGDLTGKQLLLLIGKTDTVVSPEKGRELAEQLRKLGASVTVHEVAAGHQLTAEDLKIAKQWIENQEKKAA